MAIEERNCSTWFMLCEFRSIALCGVSELSAVQRSLVHLSMLSCMSLILLFEQQPQKARPGFSMAQYTYEWTTIVLEFLSKQLVELAPPTAAVATMDNAAFRATWTARFSYSFVLPFC